MLPRVRAVVLATLLLAFRHAEAPVTLCDLAADPAAYDHRSIEITAFVSHGFEDFTLFDPRCPDADGRVWVEYGGRFASGTIYCCDVGDERTREKPLVVEDVVTTIVENAKLRQFDHLVQRRSESVVHAVLRGRFFAGEKTDLPGGTYWTGYGHFGLHSLVVIEEVLSVDPQDLPGSEYGGAADAGIASAECIQQRRGMSRPMAIEEQRQAETGTRTWAFTNPTGVAAEAVHGILGDQPGLRLRASRTDQGRITYRATVRGRPSTWWIVVSRPYWLTFYAADPRRTVWTAVAIHETGCEDK